MSLNSIAKPKSPISTMSRRSPAIQTLIALLLMLLLLLEGISRDTPHAQLLARGLGLALLAFSMISSWDLSGDIRLPKSILPLTGLALYLLALLPAAPLRSHGVDILLDLGYALLFFGAVSATLSWGWRTRSWANALLILSGLIAMGNAIFFLNWLGDLLEIAGWPPSFPPFGYRLPGAFLSHPNIEAGFLCLALPQIVYRLVSDTALWRRISWGLLLGLVGSLIFLTSSRAAWISLAGAMVVFALASAPASFAQAPMHAALARFKYNRRVRLIALATIPVLAMMLYALIIQARSTGHQPLASARSTVWSAGLALVRESPFFGHGPGSTHILILEASKTGPEDYVIHPHNLILHLGSEGGLVAISLVTLAAGLLLRGILSSRGDKERIAWAAMAAGLTAAAIHNQADVLFEAPAYTGAVLILAASALNGAPPREWITLRRRPGIMLMLAIGLAILAGTLVRMGGAADLREGIEAYEQAPSKETANVICVVHSRWPQQAHYAFQCGLAKARLASATEDPVAYDQAIQAFQAGLKIDPHWPYHWADLGALGLATGDFPLAETAYQEAISRSPDNALFHLNLGRLYEATGRRGEAALAYRQALFYDPWLALSFYFEMDPGRASLVAAQESFRFNTPSAEWTWKGWIALQNGAPQQAQQAFENALASNPRSALAWAGMARLASDNGHLADAIRAAEFAELSGSRNPLVHLTSARIHLQAGNLEAALDAFLKGFRALEDRQIAERYYNIVYRRPYLAYDLVPQLRLARASKEMLEALDTYQRLLIEAGKTAMAEEVAAFLHGQ